MGKQNIVIMDNIKNFLGTKRPRDHSKTKHFSPNSNHSAKSSGEPYPGSYARAARGRSLEVKNTDFISADDATKVIRQGNATARPRTESDRRDP